VRGGWATLEVHAAGCAYAWETLVVDRRIVGKVIGADGLPAANIRVELVPTRPPEQINYPSPCLKRPPAATAPTNCEISGRENITWHQSGSHSIERHAVHSLFLSWNGRSVSCWRRLRRRRARRRQVSIPDSRTAKQRQVAGFVYWPNGRPAEKVGVLLEDIRWPWQTNAILTTSDSNGHFEISAFDGTAYRIHAVTMVRFTNETVSAEPMTLDPGTDPSKPIQTDPHTKRTLCGRIDRQRAGTLARRARIIDLNCWTPVRRAPGSERLAGLFAPPNRAEIRIQSTRTRGRRRYSRCVRRIPMNKLR
jgi:hypothetical protein